MLLRRAGPDAASPASAGDDFRTRDPGTAALIAILAAICLARIIALFVSPSDLGFDEAQYWAWSRELRFGYFSKPPMIAWFMALEDAICGSGAACLRAGSPIVHFAAALILALLARRLYGAATGFWTGVFHALLPGVAVSSFLMTTDVLLLLFWSAALYVLFVHIERPGWVTALAFGALAGAGLNAKYAMGYLPVLAGIAAIAEPTARRALVRWHSLAALAVMAAMIAPNFWWNIENGFATFSHTGENIGWSLDRLNPVKGFSFLGAQFGLAGPVVFGAMLTALFLNRRSEAPGTDRLLLWLSMPLIGALTVQGFLSQANPNWAAAAYPAGLIVATALMVRHRQRVWFNANLAICGGISLFLVVATATFEPRTAERPLHKLRELDGWSETAAGLAAVARARGARRVVTWGRPLTAGMIWALRGEPLTVLAWVPPGSEPGNQFELDAPWRLGDGTEGALLFGVDDDAARLAGAHPITTIGAPIYLARDGRMTVYGFGADQAPGRIEPSGESG